MLRNGLVQVAPSPAARAADAAASGRCPEFMLYLAIGPTRYVRLPSSTECSAVECGTWNSVKFAS